MKKRLSGCSECGDDAAILTQVSSSPEVILLCTDCYNVKNSNEIQNHIGQLPINFLIKKILIIVKNRDGT